MIIHVLADGREVDSIEGMVVPTTGSTAAVYRIVSEFSKNHPSTKQKKEEKNSATA